MFYRFIFLDAKILGRVTLESFKISIFPEEVDKIWCVDRFVHFSPAIALEFYERGLVSSVWSSIFVTRLTKYQQLRFQDFKMIKIPKEFQYFWRTPSVWRSIFVTRLMKYQQVRFQNFKMIKIPKESKYFLSALIVRVFCWDNGFSSRKPTALP